jgi:RNA polymerase primary sigma factor
MNKSDFDQLNAYLNAINSKDIRLSKQEELMHVVQAQAGDRRSMNILIGSNIKYVVSIAKRHAGCGVPIVDLVQEGVIMLMKAISKFNAQAENNLRSYSAMYIQKGITDSIANHGRTVRLPMHKELERYLDEKDGKDTSNLRAVRLDNQISEESKNTLADLLTRTDPSIDAIHERDQLRDVIDSLLSDLDERERVVLKLHFGIDCEYEMPATRIAEELGVSQPTVSSIIKRAIEQLKPAEEAEVEA